MARFLLYAITPMELLQLPLEIIHHLIFGWDQYFGVRPKSVTMQEPEAQRPVLMPADIGQILKANDQNEDLFHIEFFDDRAEVWSSYAWKHSVSRRFQVLAKSEERSAEWTIERKRLEKLQAKKGKIREKVLTLLSGMNAKDASIQALVDQLIKAPKEITDRFGITEIINEQDQD